MLQTFLNPQNSKRAANVVGVYRLDLNDALVSGNKFYKLKPWLEKSRQQQKGLLSCGGAFSNHLHALAAAGQKQGIKTAALVRGLQADNLTHTLQACQQMGMQLLAVSRSDYKNRYAHDFADSFADQIDFPALWVPEGGTDADAVTACEEIARLINNLAKQQPVDALWVAVGSGGTVAGIARALNPHIKLYAVPVIKHWTDVKQRVTGFLAFAQANRIIWIDDGAYGGFGRCNRHCQQMHLQLEQISGIPLDPVYTGKLMRRMLAYYQSGEGQDNFPVMLHSGGLQGRRLTINEAL